MKWISCKIKDIIIHTIFFLSLFCSPYNQFTYWFVCLVFPLILYKWTSWQRGCCYLKRFVKSYLVVAVLTFLSSLLMFEFYYPVKTGVLMVSCSLLSWVLLNRIDSKDAAQALNDGIICASIIFSIIAFSCLYNGNNSFEYEEGGWLGKNVIALNIFIGYVCAIINYLLSRKLIYLVILPLLIVVIFLTTSLKIIVCTVFLLTFLYNWRSIRNNFMLFALFFAIYIFMGGFIVEYFESGPGLLVKNRFLTMIGLAKYATQDLSFVDSREDLMAKALDVFYNNPFGVGLENTRLFIGTYSHNTFVELLCGGSVFLLGAFLLFIYKCFRSILHFSNNYRTILLAVFLVLIFISNAMKIYDSPLAIFTMIYISYLGYIITK